MQSLDIGVIVRKCRCELALPACRVLPVDDNAIASGDEDGLLKTWDLRTKSSTREFSEHTDFISDLVYYEAENCLLAVSGDGTLSINDLKSGKVGVP